MHMRRPILLALLVAVIVVAALAASGRVAIAESLADLVSYVRGAGAIGVLVYALAYVVSAVALLPGAAFTLAAGFLYGPVAGTAIASPISVVAATAAFLLGRTVARDWVARRIANQPTFAAIDEAVGDQGFKIVALLRLSPLVPFNLLNYALALTNVRLRDYVVASWIGMLPVTAMYVYLGSLVTSISDLAGGPSTAHPTTATRLLYWGGLLATIAVVVLVTRAARQALARALNRPQ
jgi:uncharacterized membrane protein YdjX (TVP38/TMEM64 family)